MTIHQILLRRLRRASAASPARTAQVIYLKSQLLPQTPNHLLEARSYAFTSAEEAAAERRRRKRLKRIEPPMWALRRDHPPPHHQQGGNCNPPKGLPLPDSTSSLTGARLNLHNRVQSLIRADDLDSTSAVARRSVFSNVRPTVFMYRAIIAAMYRAGRYNDSKNLFQYFFNQFTIIPNIVSYNIAGFNNMITRLCEVERWEEAENYFVQLQSKSLSPDVMTYRTFIDAYVKADKVDEALEKYRLMVVAGLRAIAAYAN